MSVPPLAPVFCLYGFAQSQRQRVVAAVVFSPPFLLPVTVGATARCAAAAFAIFSLFFCFLFFAGSAAVV